MNIVYFVIALGASVIGSISGVGSGVIIKPVFDAVGTMNVSTVSFLSSATVLVMSIVSLIRSKGTPVRIEPLISVFLAVGAAVGGIFGKIFFSYVKDLVQNDSTIGLIQAVSLMSINILVFLFMIFKSKIKMFHIKNPVITLCIGWCLGFASVFMGVGGGPINVAVLYLFYSMGSKIAALNSLFIIMCSQISGITQSVVSSTVPQFSVLVLSLMTLGGVIGAIAGSKVSKKISELAVEKIFNSVMILLIVINIINVVQFSLR